MNKFLELLDRTGSKNKDLKQLKDLIQYHEHPGLKNLTEEVIEAASKNHPGDTQAAMDELFSLVESKDEDVKQIP